MQNQLCPQSGQNVNQNVNAMIQELRAAGVPAADVGARLAQARKLSRSMRLSIKDAAHEIAVTIFVAGVRGQQIEQADRYAAKKIKREVRGKNPNATCIFFSGGGWEEKFSEGDILTFVPRAGQGRREKEAAARLGVDPRTVRRRVAAARARLKTQADFFISPATAEAQRRHGGEK